MKNIQLRFGNKAVRVTFRPRTEDQELTLALWRVIDSELASNDRIGIVQG